MPEEANNKSSNWTFLTNHAHVLLCLAKSPSTRIRDIASDVGITERAVQKVIADLIDEGFITRQKEGRRNYYTICSSCALKHPIEWHKNISDLINLIFD